MLNLEKDSYTIVHSELSELFSKIFHSTSLPVFSKKEESYLQKLLQDRIIETKTYLFPFSIDHKIDSLGVSNMSWKLPTESLKRNSFFTVFKALLLIFRVHLLLKTKGLYSTMEWIKNSVKDDTEYLLPSKEHLEELAAALNKACTLYPKRTKCLEWAISYVLLSLKKGWKCNLEVGIQNYPFFAHAWVECGGQVIMDSQEWREGLAIILNEPFRKETS